MYSSLSDFELQKLVFIKDARAFEVLYAKYWDRVFAVCKNRVGDDSVAKDLVQDVFLSLWENKNIREINNLAAYLSQATKFAFIKYINRASRYQNMDDRLVGILDRAENMSLEEALDSKMLRELLFEEVERLPKKTRLIFVYSRLENLNSHEIAEKLHISHRTVENQISYALKQLRNFLKNIKIFIFF